MKKKSIFEKIVLGIQKSKILYQDELITAFEDKFPKAPVHVLVVTNSCIPTLNEVNIDHQLILGKMILIAVKIAKKKNISSSGYRIIINCNEHGGQEVYHLHLHLIGGKKLGNFF